MILDQAKAFIADLARPFAIYATAGAGAYAIVEVSARVTGGESGAIYVGAVLAGLGALYGAKAWEVNKTSGHAAEVEKIRAQASPPPANALAAAPAAEDDAAGELPLDQRVALDERAPL